MSDTDQAPEPEQTFQITTPDEQPAQQMVKELCKTDLLRGGVQVLSPGGKNTSHSHTGQDGFWLVLEGEMTFYGKEDDVRAVLGEHEGILIPRNLPYWFENTGQENAVLLHVSAFSETTDEKTVHYGNKEELDFAFYDQE